MTHTETLIAAIVGGLAWPATLVIIAVVFRPRKDRGDDA